MATREPGWRWAAALLAGLALRAGFVWAHPRFTGDTLVYGDLAHNLLVRHTYGLTDEGQVRPTLIRLPGYPLFLAACFVLFGMGNYLGAVSVQVAVDLLSCFLLGKVAERLFGARAGFACVSIAALCPFTANYAAAALTETLSIFAVVLAFWTFVRWIGDRSVLWAGLVGVALCGAALLRPDGVLLAAAVLPGMGWVAWQTQRVGKLQVPGSGTDSRRAQRSRPWAGASLSAGLLAGCLGLWGLRNSLVFHVFQPLAPKYANDPGEPAPVGFARWYRTWATGLGDTARVYWLYDGGVLRLEDLPPWAFDSAAQRAATAALYARYNADTSSTPDIEAAFAQLAGERERAHPVRTFFAMPLARLGDMWLRPRTELLRGMQLTWWRPTPRYTWPRVVLAWGYGLANGALLVCAGLGLWQWRRAGWGGDGVVAATMMGFVLLRSGLLLTIDNSEPRYVLECYPVVILLAATTFVGPKGPPVQSP